MICTSIIALIGLSMMSASTIAAPAAAMQGNAALTTNEVAADYPTVINGVDISKWQGAVDFAKIKSAGISYVFIKATQGKSEFDPDYKNNVENARAAGLAAGSYHFYMTDDDAESQFANLSSRVSLQAGDLPPVVDIEVISRNSLPDAAAEFKKFLGMIEKRYGVKPILYSGESFANEYLTGLTDYPLWIAEYDNAGAPKLPSGWKQWTFWQYTQGGTVAGVDGKVDLDRFNGTREQFQGLLVR